MGIVKFQSMCKNTGKKVCNTGNFISGGMRLPWTSVNCISIFFCRNKVLTTEVKALKQQMATVLEKGRHDDELIAALMVYFRGFFSQSTV